MNFLGRARYCIVWSALSATSGYATNVFSCSETAMVSNSCGSVFITDFGTVLQWNALGPANGIPFTNTSTATVNGVNISVSDGGNQMILADNYGLILVNGHWVNPSLIPGAPFHEPLRFDAPPDVAPAGLPPVGDPGDHLVGVFNNSAAMLLSFSTPVNEFALRAAATSSSVFDLNWAVYATPDGTGTPLASGTFLSLSGGGTCPGLFSNPPVPCNDAPWLVGTGLGGASSLVLSTSDTNGFFIDNLFLEIPEPGTAALTICALLPLACMRWRRRRNAAGSKADDTRTTEGRVF